MNRRAFIGSVGTTLLASSLRALAAPARNNPPFASFDNAMEQFMAAKNIPGGALSVVKDKRLVYARGYGWANQEKRLPVNPRSLFRIASISKPFTAVAILKFVEQKKLTLNQRALDFIDLSPILGPDAQPDPRWQQITVRHLLQHTGGFDRDKSFDPMFRPGTIARAAQVKAPANTSAIVRYMLGQPLDFTPGTSYAYSNFGYCLLGRIIEKVSGQPYETFVKQTVLSPIGIRNMRLGRTIQPFPDEVVYYDHGAPGNSVFPDVTGKVASPYGSFYLEAMDAHGGWIASAVDLARFAAALHDPNLCPLLKTETLKTMHAPPAPPVSRQPDGKLNPAYYGCGWSVRPVGKDGKANVWHNGKLDGTSTLLVRRWDGLSWAALFNSRVDGSFEIDAELHRAADAVKAWPSENLFSTFA
jgi:CubicO group peptidase (beta-lactamase class C family)